MANKGMDPVIAVIRNVIETQLDNGIKKFIIFPFGDVGIKVKNILNNAYGIKEEYIIDNHLCKYNSEIKSIDYLKTVDCHDFAVVLSTRNDKIHGVLRELLVPYFKDEQILDIFKESLIDEKYKTKVGKYSYGPLCNHWLVESVGAFCSFAIGSDVVVNHAINYITTHPIIYADSKSNMVWREYDEYSDEPWYMEGLKPRGIVQKLRRISIGNDVWIGKNVTITNGVNIGNGVIAGAGAVITKDVPDYAIVAGVPARIIRYRYSPDQIAALNRIQWWNWTDDEIRERYDDFYLPIEEFIAKYDG